MLGKLNCEFASMLSYDDEGGSPEWSSLADAFRGNSPFLLLREMTGEGWRSGEVVRGDVWKGGGGVRKVVGDVQEDGEGVIDDTTEGGGVEMRGGG